jgi:hypothetical protein
MAWMGIESGGRHDQMVPSPGKAYEGRHFTVSLQVKQGNLIRVV